ncbi:MAG: FAD-dependent oxidoreductase [Hyphomicrobiaceae bacterium]
MANSSSNAHPKPRKQLVLVGGGHAQVFVLRAFAITPHPDVDVTLITKDVQAPYSGMLPGFVAGHYTFDDCHIDLNRLAKLAGANLIHAPATAIDTEQQCVHVDGHAPVAYDILSINVGITPSVANIDGATEHALIVKPVSTFAQKWKSLENKFKTLSTAPNIVIIGGGAAGFELSLAAKRRFETLGAKTRRSKKPPTVTLVAGKTLIAQHNRRARRLAYGALTKAGIKLIENDVATSVKSETVHLASGSILSTDATLIATGATAAPWFAKSQLPVTQDGFVKSTATLQVCDHPNIFAVGDCATNIDHPRPKSGVFAVRQGPPLVENLLRLIDGENPKPFAPQTDFLTLLSLGRTSAIASRGVFAAQGHWAWIWKDWIDRRFMSKFNNLEI